MPVMQAVTGSTIDTPLTMEGARARFLAPSITFLRKFHHLNRRQHRVEGSLRDTAKTSTLEHEFQAVCADFKCREQALIRGIAWAWDEPERVTIQPIALR